MEVQDSSSSGDSNELGATGITTLSSEFISSHILTKLDGQSLASASCSCRQLRTLCSEQNLWKNICNSVFPSTTDPLVCNAISNFPSGHRSFYSHTFSTVNHHHQQKLKCRIKKKGGSTEVTPEFISGVDVKLGYYFVYSKVIVMDSRTGWSMSSPVHINLVKPGEIFQIPIKLVVGEESQIMKTLEEDLKLSWIIIDPAKKKAINLSSHVPVDVRRHWYTNYIEVRYVTVMRAAGVEGGCVRYAVSVTCEGKEGEEMQVRVISMQVKDIEGNIVNGRDTLVNLLEVMDGKRTKLEIGEKKTSYQKFLEMRSTWRNNKEKRDKRINMVCMGNSWVKSPVYGAVFVAQSGPHSFILDSNCVAQIVPRRLRCMQESVWYNFPVCMASGVTIFIASWSLIFIFLVMASAAVLGNLD